MMDNKAFAEKLEARTKEFAININRLSASLPDTTQGQVVRNHITKSGTGAGASYREANRAVSKAF